MAETIIVVLGAPNDEQGNLSQIALERGQRALEAARAEPGALILPTGGWGEHFNTTDLPHHAHQRRNLLDAGLESRRFLEGVESANTVEDAQLAAQIIRRHDADRVVVVTSDFHVPRARFLFERALPEANLEFAAATTNLPPEELEKLREHERRALQRLKEPSKNRPGSRLSSSLLGVVLFGGMVAGQPSVVSAQPNGSAPPSTVLAEQGRAVLTVVVAAESSDGVRQAAGELATMLGRMSGATFAVVQGDGREGIVVGRASDFPELDLNCQFNPEQPSGREDYLLRSHERGIYLIGATEFAVRHAVWDMLGSLGFRQYFPGPVWEIVPRLSRLEVTLDTRQSPSYWLRRMHYGYGAWGQEEKNHYADWEVRNRMGGAFNLQTGHAYGRILRARREEFAAHPEYLALVGGERKGQKFCISNPGLRRLVVAHAVETMQAHPDRDSISMDPSDGGGWCECDACADLGSVSDRALMLANEVAEAINGLGLGEKYVGMYAYNQHSPPPSIPVHPHVIVSAATAFTQGGFSPQAVMEGWQKQGATTGVREYFSVHTWDKNRPGAARAANSGYLRKTIPEFYRLGARFMIASGGNDWGCSGLGYWLAARMLWDVRTAEDFESLREDFLTRAFGPARDAMDEFYARIDGVNRPLLSEDLIGRMYRDLQTALQAAAGDEAIAARILDLVLYTRYVEKYFAYANASGAERQALFEDMLKYGYRIRKSMMISSKSLHRDLPSRDRAVRLPSGTEWQVSADKNPLKDTRPIPRDEILAMLTRGVSSNDIFAFTPVEYGEDLVPATPLNLPEVALGDMGYSSRGRLEYYTWIGQTPGSIELKVTGGMIARYRNRGNVRFNLFSPQHATLEAVSHDDTTPPDGQKYAVTLSSPYEGLHRLEWNDGGDMTKVVWPEGLPMTLRSSMDRVPNLQGRWSLYFYVPRGTRTVAGYAANDKGTLRSPDGQVAFDFASMKEAGYFEVPVAEGQDGKLWKFHQCQSSRRLLTVPPYLARNGRELLLPREVVVADATTP